MLVAIVVLVLYLVFAHQSKKAAKQYFEQKWKDLTKEVCIAKLRYMAKIDLFCGAIMLGLILYFLFGASENVRNNYGAHLILAMFVLAIPSFIARGALQYFKEKFPPEPKEH
jgi:hypothetical protein